MKIGSSKVSDMHKVIIPHYSGNIAVCAFTCQEFSCRYQVDEALEILQCFFWVT